MQKHELIYAISNPFYAKKGLFKISRSLKTTGEIIGKHEPYIPNLFVAFSYPVPAEKAVSIQLDIYEKLQDHRLNGDWFQVDIIKIISVFTSTLDKVYYCDKE